MQCVPGIYQLGVFICEKCLFLRTIRGEREARAGGGG